MISCFCLFKHLLDDGYYPQMDDAPTFSKPKYLPASQSPIMHGDGVGPRSTFFFTCEVHYTKNDARARFNVSFVSGTNSLIKRTTLTLSDLRAVLYDEELFTAGNGLHYNSWAGTQVCCTWREVGPYS